MKLAVIDCGTNTFNLLILNIVDGKVNSKILSTRESVKLGEGNINNNMIDEMAFKRAINAFKIFNQYIELHQADKVLAYATSAIRDASNGWQLTAKIRELFNISIDVIDGLTEANFIFLGVNEAVELNEHVSLIMDIGGGSCEFILARKNELLWKESFNIGAARILEAFKPSNPITKKEIENINTHFKQKLKNLSDAVAHYQPVDLIGSSGAFESFIEMLAVKNLSPNLDGKTTAFEVNIQNYLNLSQQVIRSTTEERMVMKGLVTMRVDMIVISCLMVNFVLNEFKINKMRVSTYSLKEGAVINYINKK